MTKLRLVIDTNILISGLMSVNSLPQQVFDYATPQAILLMSDEVQPEIENVIELAVCGEADYIITGDVDLLDLHPFQHISIMKTANFLIAVKIVR